ncbi:MAG: hypothetical protein HC884_13470 [Chloroflexaceae bacterium]|nr:hypothetical protein [Chloroflexaceae bacterium]
MDALKDNEVVNTLVNMGETVLRAIPIPFQNPHLLALLLLLPVLLLVWLVRGRGVVPTVVLLRMGIVLLLVLALANPTPEREAPKTSPLIVLVDQSDSLTSRGQATLRSRATHLIQAAEAATATEGAAGTAGDAEPPRYPVLLWFGGQVVSPATWSATALDQQIPQVTALTESLKPSVSNLEEALRVAREIAAPPAGALCSSRTASRPRAMG